MAAAADIPTNSLLEWAGDSRSTLAIVFTDIVGSTALGVEIGDTQMSEVRRAHFARSSELIKHHAGREVKTIGDSIMAVFRSAGAALDYARALHLDPGHSALRVRGVRAGIHIGSVEVTANDIFGSEVAFAARVVHEIAGAEIWTSSQTLADLKTVRAPHHESLRWHHHSGITLKGFLGTQTLWSLAPSGVGRSLAEIAPNTEHVAGPVPPPRPDAVVSVDQKQLEQFQLYQIIENIINRQALHRLPFDAAVRLVEDIAVARDNAADPTPHAAALLVLRARYFLRNGIGWRGPQREELLPQTTQLDTKTVMHLAKVLQISHQEFINAIYDR